MVACLDFGEPRALVCWCATGEPIWCKYLWGNVPALDVLRLAENEGDSYAGDLRILFAGVCINNFL
jgi:hypothetical protein